MLRIGNLALSTRTVLAPMAGVSDLAFRRLARELGCGMVYTEFVSADGIVRGGNGSKALLRTEPGDHPLGVQLFGAEPSVIAEAARIAWEFTRCDLLDINMGCWVPKVIKRGAGAALLKDPKRVEAIVRAVVGAVPVPVTAKIRAGFAADSINALEVSKAIEAGGASAVTLHARVRTQAHNGAPMWDLIGALKSAVKIPVIGNGGVLIASDAIAMRTQTGCDGVMVGRAAMSQPWIFRQVAELEAGRPAWTPTGAERLELVRKHLGYAVELNEGWQTRTSSRRGWSHEKHAVIKMRGMLVQYSNGIPGASEFRRTLETVDTVEKALEGLAKVFERADQYQAPRGFAESLGDEGCAA